MNIQWFISSEIGTKFWILAFLFFLTLYFLRVALKDLGLPWGTVAAYFYLSVSLTAFYLLATAPRQMGVTDGVNPFFPSWWILGVIVFSITLGAAFQLGIIQTAHGTTTTSKIFLLMGAIPAVTNCLEELKRSRPDGMGIVLSLAFAASAVALVVYYVFFRPRVEMP